MVRWSCLRRSRQLLSRVAAPLLYRCRRRTLLRGELGGKKQRSDQSPASRKVGIVCHSSMVDDHDCESYEIKLYVVDIDLQSRTFSGIVGDYPHADPALQIIFPYRPPSLLTVCVLKSTLYVFGGYNSKLGKRQKYAKKFAHISLMNYAKSSPTAIATPDGQKILVFGHCVGVNECSQAFELYDPQSDSWDELPGLPCKCACGIRGLRTQPCPCYYEVTCYSFISESHFYVETKDYGTFALHLGERKWSALGLPLIAYVGYFATAKGQYAIIPAAAGTAYLDGGFLSGNAVAMDRNFDDGREFTLSTFAPPNTPWWEQQYRCPCILPLQPINEIAQVCNTCILQIENCKNQKNGRNEARILIDVCRTELTPLMNTTVIKCVSLHIDLLDLLYKVTLVSL